MIDNELDEEFEEENDEEDLGTYMGEKVLYVIGNKKITKKMLEWEEKLAPIIASWEERKQK